MNLDTIEKTDLWYDTLKCDDGAPNEELRTHLRDEFLKTRDKVSCIVEKIYKDFPNLTLHDITHLDALWRVGDIIAGKDFLKNPLEGFIWGCAVLFHDIALCYDAYKGGKSGIRELSEWKEALTIYKYNNPQIKTEEDCYDDIDFVVIRNLHASKAIELITQEWTGDKSESFYLIEDKTLRELYGKTIGDIAASHHWNIEDVESKLESQIPPFHPYPQEWSINPQKIACLLRCADAANLDNGRTPYYLLALLKRNHDSYKYWKAQSNLPLVAIDNADHKGETLLFKTPNPFEEKDEAAWWVAYDAVNVVSKEICSCNNLLKENGFKVKKVAGSNSPKDLIRYIPTKKWTPSLTNINISDISTLIKKLGGEQLYGSAGDPFSIPLRELIQNARDAIVAKRFLEPRFEGEINIRIEEKDSDTWIIVEDNGVGMSERVLTETLLDFGTSLWYSSLVTKEFPGLISNGFKSKGRYGIGFFSVFMIASEVIVTSKPWEKGRLDAIQLHFRNGLSLRPLRREGPTDDFKSSISTQIKIKLKTDVEYFERDYNIRSRIYIYNDPIFSVPFQVYISVIAAGLDVDVFTQLNSKPSELAHQNIESESFDKAKWIKDISFIDYRESSKENNSFVEKIIPFLRPIKEQDKVLGYAAISTIQNRNNWFISFPTVDGLSSTVFGRENNPCIVGYIDRYPEKATREGYNNKPTNEALKKWAEEQLKLLQHESLTNEERGYLSENLSFFNVDPSSIAIIPVCIEGKEYDFTFDEIAELLSSKEIAFIKDSSSKNIDLTTFTEVKQHEQYAFIASKYTASNEFVTPYYWALNEEYLPINPNSLMGCLHRAAIKKGFNPIWKTEENVVRFKDGRIWNLIILSIKN